MKFLRILLSLHSIQLIVISALLMTYLAVTAANTPNKTETQHGNVSTEAESIRVTDADSPDRGKSTEPIISQSAAAEIIFEPRTGMETSPAIGQVITMNKTGIVAENSENEGESTADHLLFDRRAPMLER